MIIRFLRWLFAPSPKRPPRPAAPGDLAWLVLHGTDQELLEAAQDPDRPRASLEEATAALAELCAAPGMSTQDAIDALEWEVRVRWRDAQGRAMHAIGRAPRHRWSGWYGWSLYLAGGRLLRSLG